MFAWALSGPGVAAFLTGAAAIVSIYLALGVREPAFFLQVVLFACFFVFMAYYLQSMQQRTKDKQIKWIKHTIDSSIAGCHSPL